MEQRSTPRFIKSRVEAVLAIRRKTRRALILDLGRWHYYHVGEVLQGRRVPSQALVQALRTQFSDGEWAFVTGACDILTAQRAAA